jgi:hypothetical protein
MLFNLAVRSTRGDNGPSYTLRLIGRTVEGPSGTGGRDTKEYLTAEALLKDLEGLGVTTEVLTKAMRALEDPLSTKRFVDNAENVQIPFEVLEPADIYLFD